MPSLFFLQAALSSLSFLSQPIKQAFEWDDWVAAWKNLNFGINLNSFAAKKEKRRLVPQRNGKSNWLSLMLNEMKPAANSFNLLSIKIYLFLKKINEAQNYLWIYFSCYSFHRQVSFISCLPGAWRFPLRWLWCNIPGKMTCSSLWDQARVGVQWRNSYYRTS